MITPQRVSLSHATSISLKQLASRTGLSPNIVARFAMLLSFEQEFDPAEDTGQPDLTINQSSLFGELEPFLMSAFAFRCGKLDRQSAARVLAAHVARGVNFLSVRVESLADIAKMCIP